MTAILESRLWRTAERAARAWSGIAMALALIACGGGDTGAGESGNARPEGTFSIVAPMASARTSASASLRARDSRSPRARQPRCPAACTT